jgi:hypothetical protein
LSRAIFYVKFGQFEGSLKEFTAKRDAHIEYVKSTKDDLLDRYQKFEFGFAKRHDRVAIFKMPGVVFWYDSTYHTIEGTITALMLSFFTKNMAGIIDHNILSLLFDDRGLMAIEKRF